MTNIVKDERGDLDTYSHSIWAKVEKPFLAGTECHIYMEHLFLMFLDHTQRRSTVSRTPLDE